MLKLLARKLVNVGSRETLPIENVSRGLEWRRGCLFGRRRFLVFAENGTRCLGRKGACRNGFILLCSRKRASFCEAFCEEEKIRQEVLSVDPLEIGGVRENPKNRCYLCKKSIFENICRIAKRENLQAVIDGTNADDVGDYRPGLLALSELHVKSAQVWDLARRMSGKHRNLSG